MVEITDYTATEISPNCGLKEIIIQTYATADATNTLPITLADYGIAADGLLIVDSYVHTTSNSIITAEANTTSVTAGVLTITIAAGTDNDVRVIRIVGRATANVIA